MGFIPLRKAGRLPYPAAELISATYRDYSRTEKTLALKRGALEAGSRVLVADEWIETGETMRCCMAVLEEAGCLISGLAAIGVDYNDKTMSWVDAGFVSFIGRDM